MAADIHANTFTDPLKWTHAQRLTRIFDPQLVYNGSVEYCKSLHESISHQLGAEVRSGNIAEEKMKVPTAVPSSSSVTSVTSTESEASDVPVLGRVEETQRGEDVWEDVGEDEEGVPGPLGFRP